MKKLLTILMLMLTAQAQHQQMFGIDYTGEAQTDFERVPTSASSSSE